EAVAGTTRDVTEQRAAAANDRFLAELARDLAALVDEQQIIRHTVKALGQHTGVHRCYFLECLEADNVLKVTENWVRDDAPSLAGAYNIDAFGGPEWWKQYTAGDFAVADIEDHPLIGPAVFANYASAGVRAYAVQPIRQPGKWTVVLALTENKPRPWTQDELKLID